MKNIFRFFLLLVASIGTTLLLGESFNNYFFPGSGSWIVPPEIANFVNSFSFIYYFLVPVFFIIQGGPQKWIWVANSNTPPPFSGSLPRSWSDRLGIVAYLFSSRNYCRAWNKPSLGNYPEKKMGESIQ